jgi:hypothetical protein
VIPLKPPDGADQRPVQDDVWVPLEGQGGQRGDVADETVSDVADELVLRLERFVLGQLHPHLADDRPGLLVGRVIRDVVHPERDRLQKGQGTVRQRAVHLGLVDADQLAPLQQAGEVGDVKPASEVGHRGEDLGPRLALHGRHEVVDLERVRADGGGVRGVRR